MLQLVPDISNEDIPALLADIESLKALGYDVGFVAELRDALKMQPARDTAARLAASGRALQASGRRGTSSHLHIIVQLNLKKIRGRGVGR